MLLLYVMALQYELKVLTHILYSMTYRLILLIMNLIE